jgi:cytochrome-b5 reductase
VRIHHPPNPLNFMNRYQAAFIASLILPFAFLYLLSSFLNNLLLAAGYDFSRLILLGLPDLDPEPQPKPTMSGVLTALKAVDIPVVGPVNFVEIAQSPAVVITAVIVVATAFYSKVLHTGRTKPLDPNVWKEFPLEKKIQISPNTAM